MLTHLIFDLFLANISDWFNKMKCPGVKYFIATFPMRYCKFGVKMRFFQWKVFVYFMETIFSSKTSF